MLLINNEGFQTLKAKSAPSNNGATYASDNSKPFSPVTFTKCLCSYKNNYINKNKDNNESFSFVTSIKRYVVAEMNVSAKTIKSVTQRAK